MDKMIDVWCLLSVCKNRAWFHLAELVFFAFLANIFCLVRGQYNPATGEEICGSVICRNSAQCVDEILGQCHCLTGFEGQNCAIRLECDPLGNYVKNAIIRPTPYDAVPAPIAMILRYWCFDDYQFKNAENVEGDYIQITSCNNTGHWDPAPVTCLAVCPPFPTWRGYLIDSDARMEGDVVTYQCYGKYPSWEVNVDWAGKRKYRFEDGVADPDMDKRATCLANGTWYPPIPDCVEIEYDGAPGFHDRSCVTFLLACVSTFTVRWWSST